LEKNPEKNEGNGWMNFVKETEICIQFIKGKAFFLGIAKVFDTWWWWCVTQSRFLKKKGPMQSVV
jgi:hypothetical protein